MVQHRLVPIDGSVVMFMIVRRPDGGPTGYPMTGIFRGGVLEITTYRKAAKARYLGADGRVCCVIPDPHEAGRGVALFGRAVEASPDGFIDAATGEGGTKVAIDVPSEVRQAVSNRLVAQKRIVFRIDVERMREIGGEHGPG